MSSKVVSRNEKRLSRHGRIRGKVKGTADCPRLNVFCSLKFVYVQAINDDEGKVVAKAHSKELQKKGEKKSLSNIESAIAVGKMIATRCLEQKIDKVVFDRGGYKYHGKIKALADSARENGLKF